MNCNLSPIQRGIRRERWKRRAEKAVLPLLELVLAGILVFAVWVTPEPERTDMLIIGLLVWIVAHMPSERR